MFNLFNENKLFRDLLEQIQGLLEQNGKMLSEIKNVQSGKIKKITNINITLTGIDAVYYEELLETAKKLIPAGIDEKTFIQAFNQRIILMGLTSVSNFLISAIRSISRTLKENKNEDNSFDFS